MYWFRDPVSVCDPSVAPSDSVADGIWIHHPDSGILRLPEQPDFEPEVGFQTASHWTEHLCVVGMGTHTQFGKCDSQYQFTALYDVKRSLVGIVNAVNLASPMQDHPKLIETVPAGKLLGLVFNETRFDPCFNLNQPRMFIHVYLRKPELEYQSCAPPTKFTLMNDQAKRCKLCWDVAKSLSGPICDLGNPLASAPCCQAMDVVARKPGSCYDQGCAAREECPDNSTESSAPDAAASLSLMILATAAVFCCKST